MRRARLPLLGRRVAPALVGARGASMLEAPLLVALHLRRRSRLPLHHGLLLVLLQHNTGLMLSNRPGIVRNKY